MLAIGAGSPAARAGVMAGDLIVAINGVALSPTPSGTSASYAGVAAAYASLERASAARIMSLEIERTGIGLGLPIAPSTGCASQVQLRTSPMIEAKANGRNVTVTTALLGYVANDDELALAIAHEMAHNALGHRASLDAAGVRRGILGSYGDNAVKVLETERAADRLAYYLMARAGFDLGVVPGFWSRLYAGPAGGFANPRSHPTGAARIAEAHATIAEITRKRTSGHALTP